jgi:uncharacterized protein (DUF2141 family)
MGPIRQRQSVLLGAALAACPTLTAAAELRIEVAGLRNAEGMLFVAVCAEDEFLQPFCRHVGRAPASEGVVTVADVPPGTYAVQAVHDENGNEQLDRPGFLPLEGLGFSRDAPMRMGPPRFADAAFDLAEPGAVVRLTMRYFQ